MRNFNVVGLWILAALVQFPAWAEDSEPAYDARLSEYAYPFPVKTFPVSSQRQELEMAYMYLPPKQDQPVVLLLHGKNFSAAYWQRIANWLQEKGYGVLMPDQIGFGKSSKPQHYQFSLQALARNSHNLVRSLDLDTTVVMGHSMGGMLAMRYSLMFPEAVTKLVLVNPIGLEDYLDYVQYKDPAFFYKRELGKSIEDVRQYQRQHYYDGKWSPEYEQLIEIHKGWINGDDWEQVAWNNALTYDMIFTGSVANELEEIDVPVTLLIGTRDTTGPGRGWKKPGVDYTLGQYDELGKRAATRIPVAQLMEMPGLGHLPQFEDWQAFQQRLEEVF